MARGNKFKPRVVAVAPPAAPAAAAPPADPAAASRLPPPSPARDGTRGASTTAAAPAHTSGLAHPQAHTKKRASPPPAAGKGAQATTTTTRLAVPTLVVPPMPGKASSSTAPAIGAANWLALKAAASIGRKQPQQPKGKPARAAATAAATVAPAAAQAPGAIGSTVAPTRILAMDCEMVGVGPGGARSALARVCIINEAGAVLLDTHVAQRERVTDYRTRVSGVTPACLRSAPDLAAVRERVERLIDGRLLVGHAISHDLTALMVSHPRALVRDTARFPPLMRATAPGRRPKARRLRDLAAEVLGLTIQGGAHSPVDDARAALYLYQRFRREWEAAAKRPGGVAKRLAAPVRGGGGRAAATAAAADAEAALAALAAQDDMADI
jgi:RNA exonuclease 4